LGTRDIRHNPPRSAEWFVDIGAGQGELCTLFATLRHVPRVVAIEPIEPAVIALCANLDHNSIHLDRAELFRKFVGTKKSADYIEIDQPGINLLVHGLIKINVDGSDFNVLKKRQRSIFTR
jgi:tRNA G46 methylase TrmB